VTRGVGPAGSAPFACREPRFSETSARRAGRFSERRGRPARPSGGDSRRPRGRTAQPEGRAGGLSDRRAGGGRLPAPPDGLRVAARSGRADVPPVPPTTSRDTQRIAVPPLRRISGQRGKGDSRRVPATVRADAATRTSYVVREPRARRILHPQIRLARGNRTHTITDSPDVVLVLVYWWDSSCCYSATCGSRTNDRPPETREQSSALRKSNPRLALDPLTARYPIHRPITATGITPLHQYQHDS